tara:strand:- start:739 stop:1446 length:708 start_codon:yes stop_codon:yes gene_type:complete
MNSVCTRHKKIINKAANLSYKAYSKEIDGVFIEDVYTDAQSYVGFNDGDIIITGQGTTTMRDWTIDFQVWKTKVEYLNNVQVHAGFIRQYNAIRNRIHEEVKKYIDTCERIVCTGHSLFGAIATIAALDCAMQYSKPIYCITFGSPRVGGRDFAKLFNSNIEVSYRCVLEKDPITFTPLPIRFKHVRGGLKFGKANDGDPSLYNCIGCRIKHHSMDTYAKKALEMVTKSYVSNII